MIISNIIQSSNICSTFPITYLKSHELYSMSLCIVQCSFYTHPPLGGIKTPQLRDDTLPRLSVICLMFFNVNSHSVHGYTPPQTFVYIPPNFNFLEITLQSAIKLLCVFLWSTIIISVSARRFFPSRHIFTL